MKGYFVKSPISVIIPIYNVEPYLCQCLESVIAQSFSDFEVIGINDKSGDNSASIFEQFLEKDSRFKLIHHSENLGLPSARNSGISQATGEYLFFLDSDDWISPHALKLLFELLQKDKVDVAIGGTLKCYEESGKALCRNHAYYMEGDLHRVTIFDTPQLNWSVISCNKLIKRDFIQKNNLYFSPEPRRFEDMLTYKWYLSGAKVSLTTDITYFYRQRSTKNANGSIMQTKDISVMRDKFLAFADITEFMLETGYFNSKYDPINSEFSFTNLPRALSWILPYVVNNYSETMDGAESLKSVFHAFKRLCLLFPMTYVETMPTNLQTAYNYIVKYELNEAIKKISSLYKK